MPIDIHRFTIAVGSPLPLLPPSPLTVKAFTWYYKNNVLNHAPFTPFAPVKCRTVFVESYTARLGVDPANWDDSIDGVATVGEAGGGSGLGGGHRLECEVRAGERYVGAGTVRECTSVHCGCGGARGSAMLERGL